MTRLQAASKWADDVLDQFMPLVILVLFGLILVFCLAALVVAVVKGVHAL